MVHTSTTTEDFRFLQSEFLKVARVIDVQKGYVSVPSFNLRMKPAILWAAANIFADKFKNDEITAVHGIPHSGNYLATAVSLALEKSGKEIRLHTSRKDKHVPASWKDVYHKEIRSFTTSIGGHSVFAGINLSFVKRGDRVLLVDDVCASGTTAVDLIKGLQDKGVQVMGFGVLFDKVFQGGIRRIEELGVKTLSCVRVKSMGENNLVDLLK